MVKRCPTGEPVEVPPRGVTERLRPELCDTLSVAFRGWHSTGSHPPSGSGSRPPSPSPRRPRSRAGRPSPRATTPSSWPRPARARRWPRSCGASTASSPSPVPEAKQRTRLLYISPLRALAFDVEKNLRAPLKGIQLAAERLGVPFTEPTVGVRTGDTSSRDRQALVRHPPDLLITTPESLYLMLTSGARDTLRNVEAVIVDEIHALAPTKRGAHLMLSLERLDALCERPPQRIGLSATQRPLDEIARFLGGYEGPAEPRPVTIVDAGIRKPLELEVVVPVEDMGDLGQVLDEPASGPAAGGPARKSIWPSVYPRILQEVLAHRSTIIFCNARRLAERLAARLNELADDRGHRGGRHGRPGQGPPRLAGARAAGRHRGPAEAGRAARPRRHLQPRARHRHGRRRPRHPGRVAGCGQPRPAAHRPGRPLGGRAQPGQALPQAPGRPAGGGDRHPAHARRASSRRPATSATRSTCWPSRSWPSPRWRRSPSTTWPPWCGAAPAYADLTDDVLDAVLDLLAGRYPSDEFGELRPRIVWDRVAGRVRARDGAKRLAVTSGGTIPDRGLFGVFLPDGTRVGELDEEMVYESRPGETFLLGASTWRIEDITFERVVVTPAPGQPGKMPFWHGDRPGRPLELGRALGAFVRDIRSLAPEAAHERLHDRALARRLGGQQRHRLPRRAGRGRRRGARRPHRRGRALPRRDRRLADLRPLALRHAGPRPVGDGGRATAHGPLRHGRGDHVERRRHRDPPPRVGRRAARRRDPRRPRRDRRARARRAAQHVAVLLALPGVRGPGAPVAPPPSRLPHAPVAAAPAGRRPARGGGQVPHRSRSCWRPAGSACRTCSTCPPSATVLADLRSRKIRLVTVDTQKASPFAQSLLFSWIAAYMYEGDAPLAERRAAALALDRDLLRELLGAEELRELIDADVLADLELDLQSLSDHRRARSADEVHDLLRRLGDLSLAEIDLRSAEPGAAVEWAASLVERAARHRAADRRRGAPRGGRGRGALPRRPRRGRCPSACRRRSPSPSSGRSSSSSPATPAPTGPSRPAPSPGASPRRSSGSWGRCEPWRPRAGWCWASSGPTASSGSGATPRSCASSGGARWPSLRKEVEPVEPAALARFLPAWQGVGSGRRGLEALVEALGVLQGAAIPASTLDLDVLPARVSRATGPPTSTRCAPRATWCGWAPAARGRATGRCGCSSATRSRCWPGCPTSTTDRPASCTTRCGSTSGVAAPASGPTCSPRAPGATDVELLTALWDLVWAGEVTNDSLAPLRSFVSGATAKRAGGAARAARSRPRPGRLTRLGPPSGAGRWSLVAPLLEPAPSTTEVLHAQGLQLLERYGVLTREAVLAEGIEGGFAAVYGVLKALEDRGQVRRGYFVAGLGAAQFALPGAVDRLRSARDRRCRRPAPRAGRHRPRPALRRGAGVARLAGSSGAGGRCAGGARGRRGLCLARSSGPHAAHLPRRRGSTMRGSAPSSTS